MTDPIAILASPTFDFVRVRLMTSGTMLFTTREGEGELDFTFTLPKLCAHVINTR